MPRIAILIVILLLIVGAIVFLSTVPEEVPVNTIEVDVPQAGASGDNAH